MSQYLVLFLAMITCSSVCLIMFNLLLNTRHLRFIAFVYSLFCSHLLQILFVKQNRVINPMKVYGKKPNKLLFF